LGGLRAAQQLMTPILKPLLVSLVLLSGADRQPAKHRCRCRDDEMADDGTITDREGYFRHLPDQRQRHYYQLLLIRCCAVYQYHGSGDYSLVVILIFKFIGANFLRLWIAGLKTDS
jgi:hypothetical protein